LQVSLHDIRDAVINIYRERKFLAATLRDTRTVVSRLELVIGVVVHLVFLFFYLLIFRVRLLPVLLRQRSSPLIAQPPQECLSYTIVITVP